MVWRMPTNIDEGRQLHYDGRHKHEENSYRGLMAGMNGPYDSWDGDLTKSLDKVILNNHWEDPISDDGFVDPAGEFKAPYRVGLHKAKDTMRLIANPGRYVIRPIDRRFSEAFRIRPHFVFSLEPKSRYWNKTDMAYLWRLAHQYERPTIIKCAWTAPLEAAKAVGFQTRYTRDHKAGM